MTPEAPHSLPDHVMVTLVPLSQHSEDDALARVVEWLKPTQRREYPQSSAALHVPDLLQNLMREVRTQNSAYQGAGSYSLDPSSDSKSFYTAAWHLVSRGVLVPSRLHPS